MDLAKFCEKYIKPKAERMDHERKVLKKALRKLGKKKLLAMRVSKKYGGHALSMDEYFTFVEMLESYSGALGFLQRQHQAAAHFMNLDASDQLKELWLPAMAKGKQSVGVCVTHLRNPALKAVYGKSVEGGIKLYGKASWVSGYRIFNHLVVGFFMDDRDEEAFALIPFKKSATLKISKPYSTVALYAMQTVALQFNGNFVEDERLFGFKPLGSYHTHRAGLGVFVNLAGIALGFKRELQDDDEVYIQLSQDYEACRTAFVERDDDENLSDLYERMLRIAIGFYHRALYKKGASSVICSNSIERRYRELMVFEAIASSVSGRFLIR